MASEGEREVYDFVKTLLPNEEIERNTREIIAPLELDIYIKNFNVAIEFCGAYWHSEVYKNKHYHQRKFIKCKELGIRLITLFDDEWTNKQDIVKSKIASILGVDTRKVTYARKCDIRIVPKEDKKVFFNETHIQGNGASSINLGLYKDNELIACMGFYTQQGRTYLNRYATSHRVVGGASKLLTHFTKNFEWSKLITFADLCWSDGNMYEATGWKQVDVLKPDYSIYVKNVGRSHKFNFRKNRLAKLLDNYDPNLTEHENCLNNRLYRVYDCGKIKYEIDNIQT